MPYRTLSAVRAAPAAFNSQRARAEELLAFANRERANDPAASLTAAIEALALARRARLRHTVAAALRALGLAQWTSGQYRAALRTLKQGLLAAQRVGDPVLQASCVNGIGITLEKFGDFNGALDCYEHFLQLVPETDRNVAIEVTIANVALLHERLDDHEAALALYKKGAAWARAGGRPAPLLEQGVAIACARLGRLTESDRHYQRALQASQQDARRSDQVHLMANIGFSMIRRGEPERARPLLLKAMEAAQSIGAGTPRLNIHLNLGDLHLATGNADLALSEFERALTLATEQGDVFRHLWALDGCARAHAARSDYETAYKLAAEATRRSGALMQRCGTSTVRVRLMALHQQLLGMIGGPHRRAIRTLDKAAGSGTALQIAQRALAQANPRSVERPMSEREREVLALLVRGLSNREIADRLSLSQFTARFHVSSILQKLGVKTRAEAVARAVSEQLVPPVT